MTNLEKLKGRIFGGEKETNIIDSWNYLMLNYGWIPFDEFLQLDAHLVDELIERLNKINEKNGEITKLRGKRR